MSYKTIVVHVNGARDAERRIRLAAQLAIQFGAHLVGTALTGVSRFLYQDHVTAMGAGLAAQYMDEARVQAQAALNRFEEQCTALGVRSYESRLADDEAIGGLVLQSRYGDLVVVSQTDPDQPVSPLAEELPEFVAMNSVRPVLVVPYAGHFSLPAKHVLVAWDGSLEATRAVTAALPLMQRAERVTLAVFNAGRYPDAHGQEPGADIALYLARHGIKVEVSPQVTSIEIGSALLSLAADLQAELLVMGCYGHGRFREIMLGGASRTILESMTLPVLLAH